MNNRMTMFFLLSGTFAMTTYCAGWAQETVDARAMFNISYIEWKDHLKTNVAKTPSSILLASTLYDNEPFRKIVAQGVSALPYIVDGFSEDRLLAEAFSRITKWRYHVTRTGNAPQSYRWTIDEFSEISTTGGPPDRIFVYNKWWQDGRFGTEKRFVNLYSKWKALKDEKKEKEAGEAYQLIIDLGIPVLPCLVGNVSQTPQFIPAISELSGGALSPKATVADCQQWWELNGRRYVLPRGKMTTSDISHEASIPTNP